MAASASSVIWVVAKRCLSGFAGNDGLVKFIVSAKRNAANIIVNICLPFLSVLNPRNTYDSARIIVRTLQIAAVFNAVNRTKIFDTVVGTVAVDVIDFRCRPMTVMMSPSQPMRIIRYAQNLRSEVAVRVRVPKRPFSFVKSLPNPVSLSGFKHFLSSRKMIKIPCFWVVGQNLTQKIDRVRIA